MMMLYPLAGLYLTDATFEFNALGISSLTESVKLDQMGWAVFILLLLMLALPLVDIFLYKNRTLQLRIAIFAAILNLLFYALFFWQLGEYKTLVERLANGPVNVDYNIILLAMPALSVFCLVMAARGVAKDIALLKSLDRLR